MTCLPVPESAPAFWALLNDNASELGALVACLGSIAFFFPAVRVVWSVLKFPVRFFVRLWRAWWQKGGWFVVDRGGGMRQIGLTRGDRLRQWWQNFWPIR
jgi:hypothetical protein